MTRAKVIVTGATGLFGCALVPALRAAGHTVIAHGHRGAADLQADLTSADQAATMLDRVQPDVIVNLAALTNVDACEIDPRSAHLLNVRTVENLAAWLRRARPQRHLVHLSTDQVYDGPGPHAESDLCIVNTYANSKRASEVAAVDVGATVLRTNFYGPSRCAGRDSFSDWLHRALIERRSIEVFDDVQFNPMAIDALAEMIARVTLQRPAGVFNLGARGGLSKADFAFAFAAAAGLPAGSMKRSSASAMTTLKARRPKDMRMDCSLLERTLGMTLPDLRTELHRIGSAYRVSA